MKAKVNETKAAIEAKAPAEAKAAAAAETKTAEKLRTAERAKASKKSKAKVKAAEAAKTETWNDYGVSQRAGVTGFPTLVGGPNAEGVYGVVTRGYAPAEQVLAILRDWISRIAA